MINPMVKFWRNYQVFLVIILVLLLVAGGYIMSVDLGNVMTLIVILIGGVIYDNNPSKKTRDKHHNYK